MQFRRGVTLGEFVDHVERIWKKAPGKSISFDLPKGQMREPIFCDIGGSFPVIMAAIADVCGAEILGERERLRIVPRQAVK